MALLRVDLAAPTGTQVTITVQAEHTQLKSAEYPPGTSVALAEDKSITFKVISQRHSLVLNFDVTSLPPFDELVNIVEIDPASPSSPTVIDSFFGVQTGRILQILGT